MINVFGGRGFIGSAFVNKVDGCVLNDRNDYIPKTNNILYLISTVDNYNVLKDPFIDIDTNLTTLMKALSNITDRENTVFNFVSSWFVYGESNEPSKEDGSCCPKGFYSITKRTAEQLLISYCQTFGIKYRILRLANVIGTDDRKTSNKKNAIVWMINEIKAGRPVYMYDGGMTTRDIIDVDDCVDAIKLVMDKGELNTIYNIGNGTSHTVKDILLLAKNLTNSDSPLNYAEAPLIHNLVQLKCVKMDTTKLRELGYVQKYTLSDTIGRILDGN